MESENLNLVRLMRQIEVMLKNVTMLKITL